jgi:hypothetical protein
MYRCEQTGGVWRKPIHDRETDGVCIAPAPDEGKACRNSRECAAGLCACPGNPYPAGPDRVPDGTPTEGTCARFPVAPGAGWICAVEDGKVRRHGIIVD